MNKQIKANIKSNQLNVMQQRLTMEDWVLLRQVVNNTTTKMKGIQNVNIN